MSEEVDSPMVFDTGDGIRIEQYIADGVGIFFEMSDEQAQAMVDIVQNKLNARL